ncbi:dephospho-CoA kinase [Candidatus Woesearchaeota archaeon]|nr:dephospho-CoA kinase [Candidatus Woesearchaeota archaeon]
MKPYFIGVSGRSCSGKTTVTKDIETLFSDVISINQDLFFKKKFDCEERPEALMNDKLIEVIKKLKKGEEAYIPSKRKSEVFDKKIKPHKIIIVEGFLLFENKKLSDSFDKKIWVDVSDENIISRRIERRGSSEKIDNIINQIIPISKEYEEIQRKRADIIIDGNKSKKEILEEVKKQIEISL